MELNWTKRAQGCTIATTWNENYDSYMDENVTMAVLSMLVWGWQCFHCSPGTHWSLWWIKVWGGTQKERERDGYPADGDPWAILSNNWVKRRRKRGSARSIVVCNSKVWTSFIVKQGNVGNSGGNRFFNYLFVFNKDFQIFLLLLLWALPKQLKPSTFKLFNVQKRLQHVNERTRISRWHVSWTRIRHPWGIK